MPECAPGTSRCPRYCRPNADSPRGSRRLERPSVPTPPASSPAAELEAIEHLGPNTVMKQLIAGLAGKKLWGQRPGPMGKAETIEHHAGHGFARREHCLLIKHKAGVHHVNYADVFDNRSEHA